MMSSARRQLLALSGALSLAAALMALLLWNNKIPLQNATTLEIREVELARPPPPEPPPPAAMESRENASNASQMQLAAPSSPVILSEVKIMVSVPAAQLSEMSFDGIDRFAVRTFEISDLDQLPVVVSTPPMLDIPRKLLDEIPDDFVVQIVLLIDEKGYPRIEEIRQHPLPELDKHIRQYANQVRFSQPKVSGIAVRARFVWPLTLRKP